MYTTSREKIDWARQEWGSEAVELAMELVQVSDPDGAYTLLEDFGKFDAAEVVEFLYFSE